MRLLYEDEDGSTREVPELWLDGYAVGDRLLEQVPIRVTVEDGNLTCSFRDRDKPFLALLATDRLLADAVRAVRQGETLYLREELTDDGAGMLEE